jgi:hypothetical protein
MLINEYAVKLSSNEFTTITNKNIAISHKFLHKFNQIKLFQISETYCNIICHRLKQHLLIIFSLFSVFSGSEGDVEQHCRSVRRPLSHEQVSISPLSLLTVFTYIVCAGVNFTNILRTAFVTMFLRQKKRKPKMQVQKSCTWNSCTKKCWWNWHFYCENCHFGAFLRMWIGKFADKKTYKKQGPTLPI